MGTTYKQLNITERRRIERWRDGQGSEALQVDDFSRAETQSLLR
ncbi:MAG: hypothetical protein ACI84R_002827 [Candidatus Azotimanducaceae bacterium]|jgi:hypothetical protein